MEPAVDSTPAPSKVSPSPSLGRDRFSFASWLLLRALAVIHGIAFASFWVQLDGLVGANGIAPAARYFTGVHEQLGASAYTQLPSLCWIFGTGSFLPILCGAGIALSLLLFAGVAPALCLLMLWAGYLSVCSAGQLFFSFQWDSLLLEATLLAVFVAPWRLLPLWSAKEPPRLARLLVWWLLFRLMFLAGVVKLTSGDTSWRDLTALTFHFETQPLPTALGWFVHQAPLAWHRAACAGMFALELIVPFFLFAPRTLRHNAALLLAGFMVAVALTGNYTYFNFLAIALCLFSLDDAWWRQVIARGPVRLGRLIAGNVEPISVVRRTITTGVAIFAFGFTTWLALAATIRKMPTVAGFDVVHRLVAPLRSFNTYGLFAVMTRPRPELIFEGSDDGRTWRTYEFPDKPGELKRAPTWVAPHQPRLDWQLWFAALGAPANNRWVLVVCEHLLRGTPDVLALLRENPFPEKPPRHVRVIRYEYRFTDGATRSATGQWWRRTPLDVYIPPVALR